MSDSTPRCLYCQSDETTIPLIEIRYRQEGYWICPQHLPLLIHQPAKLSGILPGIENAAGTGHQHHDD